MEENSREDPSNDGQDTDDYPGPGEEGDCRGDFHSEPAKVAIQSSLVHLVEISSQILNIKSHQSKLNPLDGCKETVFFSVDVT